MQIYDMEYIKTIKNYIKREDIHSQKTNSPVMSLNDYIDLVLYKYYGKVCKDYKCRRDWKEWQDEIKRKINGSSIKLDFFNTYKCEDVLFIKTWNFGYNFIFSPLLLLKLVPNKLIDPDKKIELYVFPNKTIEVKSKDNDKKFSMHYRKKICSLISEQTINLIKSIKKMECYKKNISVFDYNYFDNNIRIKIRFTLEYDYDYDNYNCDYLIFNLIGIDLEPKIVLEFVKDVSDSTKSKLKELFQNEDFISKLLDKIPFDKSKINFDEFNKLLDDVSKSLDEVNDIQLVAQNDSIAMIRKK